MQMVTTTEAGVPIQGPSATLIYDDWYPALRTETLRKGKLATAMLLGFRWCWAGAVTAACLQCATVALIAASH